MNTNADVFARAVRIHQAGRLFEAADLYREILVAYPRHAEAAHLLGVIAQQSGDHDRAARLISEAIGIDAGQAVFHCNLGEALRALGQLENAVECFRQAIALKPDYLEALNRLGNVLRTLGDKPAAQACYEQAVEHNPQYVDALVNLASVLTDTGQFDRAAGYLERALELRPDNAMYRFYFGDLKTIANDWHAAVSWYEAALRLNPALSEAEAHLGVAWQSQDKLELAIRHYRNAIALRPNDAQTHYNLATALERQAERVAAEEHFVCAIEIDPNHAAALVSLGALAQERSQIGLALSYYDRALQWVPDAPMVRYNRALLLLKQGKLRAAWPDYEYRLRLPDFPVRSLTQPKWDGNALHGKTLLVHVEQGLGDTLQFIRYVRWIEQRGIAPVVLAQDPLLPLLRYSGFENVIDERGCPPFDCQIPLMSLPGIFGTDLTNVPAEVPYLRARENLVGYWKSRLSTIEGFKVGICWQGSSVHSHDASRSIPLKAFASLANIPGVRLINLQKHEGLEQRLETEDLFSVLDLGPDLDEVAGAFMDTAAIMKNLDLVISADTAVAHLAGGIGVPIWIALARAADWRWMLDREDTPWYPSMRLFRQSEPGDWPEVFARIRRQLEIEVGKAAGGLR